MTLDSLVGNADAFPALRGRVFFNHAGVAPLPRVAGDALRRYAEQAETDVYIDTGWYRDCEAARSTAAGLLGVSPEEIAFVKNTGEGLSTIARGLDWKPGDRVVTAACEYPANLYPWMDLERHSGVTLVTVAQRTLDDGTLAVEEDDLIAALDHPSTKLLTISHVQYASGQRMDVPKLVAACRARGVLVCLDAIQSIGVMPVDLRTLDVDFAAADGHKWMLGPEGAGLLYVRRELIDRVRPLSVGWMNVVDAQNYGEIDYTLKPDARRYECGSWNVPGFLALGASLRLIRDVGPENIFSRVDSLNSRLRSGLRASGWQVVSSDAPGRRSGSVVFDSPSRDLKAVLRTCRQERIELALREKRLRASPHFYNTEAQVDRLLDVLGRCS